MPRDGSGVATKPSGTTAVSGDTVASTAFNNVIDDIYSILNLAQPIVKGGNGETTAYAGLDALSVKGSDIASATTTNLANATGAFNHITGTTTITGLGTADAGVTRKVVFDAALTLTHNATSLILPGGVNRTTAAGDCAIFVSEGSGNWRCIDYQVASMAPYQEGTWTPAMVPGTGSITLSSPTNSMKYTKVGRMVTLTGQMTVSAVSSPSGLLTITGLPFANGGAIGNYTPVPIWVTGYSGAANIMLEAFISVSASSISVSNLNLTTGAVGSSPAAAITATTVMAISATYFIS